jgi:hypothetical protein
MRPLPLPGHYETCHPDRIKKFPYRPREFSFISTEGTDPKWRHELDHDTESVFWVLLYWLIGAQPEKEEKEPIDVSIWAGLTGSVGARIHLFQGGLTGATHSFYQPLCPLLNKLAHILNADRHWIESSDPRNARIFQRGVPAFDPSVHPRASWRKIHAAPS